MTAIEEYFTECLGRKTLVPSSLRNAAGLMASSGGVSATDCCWAASTTIPTTASRSVVLAKRRSIVCRDASASRFQWVQVERLTLTALTTSAPSASTAASGTSSARSGLAVLRARIVAAQAVGSPPTRSAARRRHSTVRSASDRISFGGRVASVAWARSSTIVFSEGLRPCTVTYSVMSRSFSNSISRVRLENSAISSSLTPAISHCGLRSAPRPRSSHSTPSSRVSRSASSAL